tara:strand:+ start:756 stop:1376 length:621 start_codon:yes stop_codon:yes gene_type:complete
MTKIVVVDYNTGNVDSVIKAVKLFENDVIFTKNPKDLNNANKIILPGQGSYNIAIDDLRKTGMFEKLIYKSLRENIPILGICLGMQIMSTLGYENNKETKGLNLIPGRVIKLKDNPNKLPHIGWNTVKFSLNHPIFKNIKNEKDFYFIHSFKYVTDDVNHSFASTHYNENFSSVVIKDTNFGIQFHPEKSLGNGIKLIKNFLNIKI